MKKLMVYKPITMPEFASEFGTNRAAWYRVRDNCSEITKESAEQCIAFMSTCRTGGFCIHVPTKEIRFLHSLESGQGNTLVQEAIQRGGTWLTCFDGYLKTLYESHGFTIVEREPNWTAGNPDVLKMTL